MKWSYQKKKIHSQQDDKNERLTYDIFKFKEREKKKIKTSQFK